MRLLPSIVVLLWSTLPCGGQTLSFSLQGGNHNLSVWAVTACSPKPIPIGEIYRLATQHGIDWLTPAAGAERLTRKSFWGKAVRYGGFAAAAAAALAGLDVIQVNIPILRGLSAGATFFNVLLPLAQREVIAPDLAAGTALAIGPEGCGMTTFYAAPGQTKSFISELAPIPAATSPQPPTDHPAVTARFEMPRDRFAELVAPVRLN